MSKSTINNKEDAKQRLLVLRDNLRNDVDFFTSGVEAKELVKKYQLSKYWLEICNQ